MAMDMRAKLLAKTLHTICFVETNKKVNRACSIKVQWNLCTMVTFRLQSCGLHIQVAVIEKSLHNAVSSILVPMTIIKRLMSTIIILFSTETTR